METKDVQQQQKVLVLPLQAYDTEKKGITYHVYILDRDDDRRVKIKEERERIAYQEKELYMLQVDRGMEKGAKGDIDAAQSESHG